MLKAFTKKSASCAAAISLILLSLPAQAKLIGVAGPLSSAGAPATIIGAPAHILDDIVTNRAMQGFDEAQGVTTTVVHLTDGGGSIALGTKVDSHMIFLNTPGSGQTRHFRVDWTFDGAILGIMSNRAGTLEAASTFELGNPATNYTVTFPGSGAAAPFDARGIEMNDGQGDGPNDGYFRVNTHTLRVGMLVSEPGDWMRVVTATPISDPGTPVPEPGTLALFGLGLAGLGFARRRKAA